MRQCDMKWRTGSYYHKGNSKLRNMSLILNGTVYKHGAYGYRYGYGYGYSYGYGYGYGQRKNK